MGGGGALSSGPLASVLAASGSAKGLRLASVFALEPSAAPASWSADAVCC
jgi:hypothetical protein